MPRSASTRSFSPRTSAAQWRMRPCWRIKASFRQTIKTRSFHGLDTILSEIESGQFEFSRRLEDIHMNVEARSSAT